MQFLNRNIFSSNISQQSFSGMVHYYPFGMLMPGRQFLATSTAGYRFGFNGQEQDNDVIGNGNLNTAQYWEYDSRIGRRWNVDPKPSVGISNYSVFNNNPNWYSDILGDTIILTNNLKANEGLMKKYNEWASSSQGKKFLKDYGEGGKYGYIKVTFDAASIPNQWGHVDANTSVLFANKFNHKYDIKPKIGQAYPNGDIVANGKSSFFNLQFTITINQDCAYPTTGSMLMEGAESIVHETQHLRIDVKSLLINRIIYSAYIHHHYYMKPKGGGWYEERYNFYTEKKDIWYKDYLSEKTKGNVNSEDEYIRSKINDFQD